MRVHADWRGCRYALISAMLLFASAPASGQLWHAARTIGAPFGNAGDDFGASVALEGSLAVVGAPGSSAFGWRSGAAFVFHVSDGGLRFPLAAGDATPSQEFGASVAISEGRIIVGAPGDHDHGYRAGAAYLFDATSGDHVFKLTPSNARARAEFGSSVAVSGRLAVVGAEDEVGSLLLAEGTAHVFELFWGRELHELVGTDQQKGDGYAKSVAISGANAVVGSWFNDGVMGGAFWFDARDARERAILNADELRPLNLGHAVAASDSRIAVGTRSWGRGLVVVHDAGTGARVATLRPPMGFGDALFGSSIAMTEDLIVVGAPYDNVMGQRAGAVYVYEASSGLLLSRLLPPVQLPHAEFGRSVAVSGTRIVVGAKRHAGPRGGAGAAFVFELGSRCSSSAIALPFGIADHGDVTQYIRWYLVGDPAADIAPPFGAVTPTDLALFLELLQRGCAD